MNSGLRVRPLSPLWWNTEWGFTSIYIGWEHAVGWPIKLIAFAFQLWTFLYYYGGGPLVCWICCSDSTRWVRLAWFGFAGPRIPNQDIWPILNASVKYWVTECRKLREQNGMKGEMTHLVPRSSSEHVLFLTRTKVVNLSEANSVSRSVMWRDEKRKRMKIMSGCFWEYNLRLPFESRGISFQAAGLRMEDWEKPYPSLKIFCQWNGCKQRPKETRFL